MKINSIKFEISVFYVALLGIVLIMFQGVLFFGLKRTLFTRLDEELKLKAQKVAQTLSAYLDIIGDSQKPLKMAMRRITEIDKENPYQSRVKDLEIAWLQAKATLGINNNYINFLGLGGASFVSDPRLPKELSVLFENAADRKEFNKITYDNINFSARNIHLRLITAPFYYKGKERCAIQVGTSLEDIILTLNRRLSQAATGTVLAILLFFLTARLLVIRILNPVEEITNIAKRISLEELSERVKTDHFADEVKNLAKAFNDMISRLEENYKYVEDFSSYAAHELKTPLAIIKGESEVALRKERDSQEYKRVITVILDESKRMLRTIEDLLLLAKLDYRPEALKFEPILLNEFIGEIYESYNILASERNIALNLIIPQQEIRVNGDKLHLRRLFFNLLDNAMKFTPASGKIDLGVKEERENVLISISNPGSAFIEEDLTKIFERFFRARQNKFNDQSVRGLGLSIAQTIARIHRGVITVKSSSPEGTTFTVMLPAIVPPA